MEDRLLWTSRIRHKICYKGAAYYEKNDCYRRLCLCFVDCPGLAGCPVFRTGC